MHRVILYERPSRSGEAIEEVPLKAAIYGVHLFKRKVFENANREGTHEIACIAAPKTRQRCPWPKAARR
jgi:hypothetical protein